jgi:LEA14-like dessication related protein
MRPSTRLLIVPLLLALTGCAELREALKGTKRPTAKITGVRLSGISLTAIDLEVDMEVANPYSVALPILGADFKLASGGAEFLAGKSKAGGSIPAMGRGEYPFTTRITFAGLLEVLSGVKPGGTVPWELALDVLVDAPVVGTIRLPLEQEGKIPIPAVPKVKLAKVEYESASLDRVAAVLEIEVKNVNSFPIDLDRLSFGLALAGVEVGRAGVTSATSLEAGKSRTLRLPIGFSPKSLGAAAFGLLTGSDASYRLTGGLRGKTPFGPIEFPLDAGGKTKIGR